MLVGAFNEEKVLIGAFSVIVKTLPIAALYVTAKERRKKDRN